MLSGYYIQPGYQLGCVHGYKIFDTTGITSFNIIFYPLDICTYTIAKLHGITFISLDILQIISITWPAGYQTPSSLAIPLSSCISKKLISLQHRFWLQGVWYATVEAVRAEEGLATEIGAVFQRTCAGCHAGGGNIVQPVCLIWSCMWQSIWVGASVPLWNWAEDCRSIHVFPFLSIFMRPGNQGMFVTCVSTLQVLEFGIGTKILCDTDMRCNCLVFVPECNIICPGSWQVKLNASKVINKMGFILLSWTGHRYRKSTRNLCPVYLWLLVFCNRESSTCGMKLGNVEVKFNAAFSV